MKGVDMASGSSLIDSAACVVARRRESAVAVTVVREKRMVGQDRGEERGSLKVFIAGKKTAGLQVLSRAECCVRQG